MVVMLLVLLTSWGAWCTPYVNPDSLPAVCAQALIQNFVRSTLTLTFVIAAARVVFNIKAQLLGGRRWGLERSVLTLLVASVFGLQAIGLDGELAPE